MTILGSVGRFISSINLAYSKWCLPMPITESGKVALHRESHITDDARGMANI